MAVNVKLSGVIGTNETMSSSKLEQLDAPLKKNISQDSTGSVGTDHDTDHSRIPPHRGSHGKDIYLFSILHERLTSMNDSRLCLSKMTSLNE
jgi:hypothetical protein